MVAQVVIYLIQNKLLEEVKMEGGKMVGKEVEFVEEEKISDREKLPDCGGMCQSACGDYGYGEFDANFDVLAQGHLT